MSMKDAYQEKLEAQMCEWNAKIDELKAKNPLWRRQCPSLTNDFIQLKDS